MAVDIIMSVKRLQVMRDLALLTNPEEPFFDSLTKLASEAIGVPVSLVSIVSNNYQYFKSMVGLPEPWASDRRTPLSHSFCQHVVATGEPLVIEDAREVDFLKDNLAIPDLNVIGYLGIPITSPDGEGLGSFCVIDDRPHRWTESDIELMNAFARLVNKEIDLRAKARNFGTLEEHITEGRERRDKLIASIDPKMPNYEVVRRLDAFTESLA